MSSQPRNERDERRLVDVAPGEMLAAGDVIQFIPEIPVVIYSRELNDQLGYGEKREEQSGIAKRSRDSGTCGNGMVYFSHVYTFRPSRRAVAASPRLFSTDRCTGDAVEFRKVLVEILFSEGGDRTLIRRFPVAAVNFLNYVHPCCDLAERGEAHAVELRVVS